MFSVFFPNDAKESKAFEYRLFPSEFDKVISFVSDETLKSCRVEESNRFLNSRFESAISVFSRVFLTQDIVFLKNKTDPNNSSILDTFEFDLLVDWHAGLYDHFHGIYDLIVIHEFDTEQFNLVNRETDLMKLFLADTKVGNRADGTNVQPFDLSYWAENYFSVLRVYFNQPLSSDARITITTPKNIIRTHPVYTNKLQEKVNDNGRVSWMVSCLLATT